MVPPRYDSPDWDDTHLLYRLAYRIVHRPGKALLRVNARGIHRIPEERGVVLAMNHFSWIDPVVTGAMLPRPVHFLGKKGIFETPVVGPLVESLNQIEVDREAGGNEEALAMAREVIEDGRVVGIYPEGTRSNYGNLLRPKRGVARLALRTGCPVVPIALLTHHFWPKGPLTPNVGEPVYINVGEPVTYGRKADRALDREFTQEVADDVMSRVEGLLKEAEDAYQAGERWKW